jgi:hypothetical protein
MTSDWLGRAFAETDKATSRPPSPILMSGQYCDLVCVVAFNTAERWSDDVSEDVAREIMRRLDISEDEMPSSLEAFGDRYLGSDRQLTLRLA